MILAHLDVNVDEREVLPGVSVEHLDEHGVPVQRGLLLVQQVRLRGLAVLVGEVGSERVGFEGREKEEINTRAHSDQNRGSNKIRAPLLKSFDLPIDGKQILLEFELF